MDKLLYNLNVQNNIGSIIFETLQFENESRASLVKVIGGISGTSHVLLIWISQMLFEITDAMVSLVTSTKAETDQSKTGHDFH